MLLTACGMRWEPGARTLLIVRDAHSIKAGAPVAAAAIREQDVDCLLLEVSSRLQGPLEDCVREDQFCRQMAPSQDASLADRQAFNAIQAVFPLELRRAVRERGLRVIAADAPKDADYLREFCRIVDENDVGGFQSFVVERRNRHMAQGIGKTDCSTPLLMVGGGHVDLEPSLLSFVPQAYRPVVLNPDAPPQLDRLPELNSFDDRTSFCADWR